MANLLLGTFFTGVFAVASTGSFFNLSNLEKVTCQNELGSHFVLEVKDNKASGSFLGRKDDLDYSGFVSNDGATFEIHSDYIQEGLIGLTIEAKNASGFNGRLGFVIEDAQEFSLKESENLSIVFVLADGSVYTEPLDCGLTFKN